MLSPRMANEEKNNKCWGALASSKGLGTWATPNPALLIFKVAFLLKRKKKREKAVDATSCPQGSQILMFSWEESSALKYSIQVQLAELGEGVSL